MPLPSPPLLNADRRMNCDSCSSARSAGQLQGEDEDASAQVQAGSQESCSDRLLVYVERRAVLGA